MQHITKQNKHSQTLQIIAILTLSISIILSIYNIIGWHQQKQKLSAKMNVFKELQKLEMVIIKNESTIQKFRELALAQSQSGVPQIIPDSLKNIKIETKEFKKKDFSDKLKISVMELSVDDFDLANLHSIIRHIQKYYPILSIKEINIVSSSQKPGFARFSMFLNLLEIQK